MLVKSEHTLGVDGIGPRTHRDSYEIAHFHFQIMARLVASQLADFDHVGEYFLDAYREDRETYFAARLAYLGI